MKRTSNTHIAQIKRLESNNYGNKFLKQSGQIPRKMYT